MSVIAASGVMVSRRHQCSGTGIVSEHGAAKQDVVTPSVDESKNQRSTIAVPGSGFNEPSEPPTRVVP